MAWLSRDYLYPRWIADGWIVKATVAVVDGCYVSAEYLSPEWMGTSWVHYETLPAGQVTVANLLALPITVFAGSAVQTTKVNATTPNVPLTKFAAIANAEDHITQSNLPNVPLFAFQATVNGTFSQIGDVQFTLVVASAFAYSKNVTAQTAPSVPLTAIEAIVTVEDDVNVAATITSVPLTKFNTTVKANTKAQAIASIAVPLDALDADVAIGISIEVPNRPAISLLPLHAGVTTNEPVNIFATTTHVPFATFIVAVTPAAEVIPPEVPAVLAFPAGGRKRRRQQPLFVTIDGVNFEVDSVSEAEEVLRNAKKLATEVAADSSEHEIKRARRRKRAPQVHVPTIESSPELKSLVDEYRDDIEEIYRGFAQDAETRELLRRKLADEDDDDAIFVLMH